ncbi:hypothetical protein FOZ60_004362 [Perkinsus olseni]|uniref:Uncharacterized protein n=2 Tax=Perkinsus olseni TaxID=32597 RepID=A0A7J6NU11_PEROL|nr:hypothetical protein FOZ60_004362 [Perkinsus olseni]
MVQRLPAVDVYKLLTAAYTGLMACLCSWAVFIMPHGQGANMTVLAPIWALVSAFLNLSANYDQSLRSIVGALIGLGLTQLIALIISSASSSGYNDWIGVVVCFPVCFFLGIADPATGCKMSKVFRSDVAMESMYIPLAFPNGQPFLHSLLTSGAFIVGSAETLVATTILNAFNLLPRHEVPPIPSFAKRAADYYETLSTYCTSGMQHAGFIDRQRAVFEEAWRAASRAAPTPELRSVIYRMAAELIALRTTLRDGAYSPEILEYIWHPLVANIVELRLETVYWLRRSASPIGDDGAIHETDLVELGNQMKIRLNEQSLIYGTKVFSGESSLSPATDIVRFQFAMSLIARFAMLSDDFHRLVREYEKSLPETKGWIHWPSRLRQYFVDCKKYWIDWWHLPFFAFGSMTLTQRFIHPLRLSITITAFALPSCGLGSSEPHCGDLRLLGAGPHSLLFPSNSWSVPGRRGRGGSLAPSWLRLSRSSACLFTPTPRLHSWWRCSSSPSLVNWAVFIRASTMVVQSSPSRGCWWASSQHLAKGKRVKI